MKKTARTGVFTLNLSRAETENLPGHKKLVVFVASEITLCFLVFFC